MNMRKKHKESQMQMKQEHKAKKKIQESVSKKYEAMTANLKTICGR